MMTKQLEVADSFFSEPYWRRVWIIQEITVAKKVKVLYGDCNFQWDDVITILSMLKDMEDKLDFVTYRKILNATHLLEFREKYARPARISLLEAMIWSRSSLATEPRDKIFALLGLCLDSPILVPIPNYKQSLGSIMAEMSKTMMIRNNSLDLICLKGVDSSYSKGCPDLPTWAPNWPRLWTGSLTIQEKCLSLEPTVCSSNSILEGPTNKILKVSAARVGSIKRLTTGECWSTQSLHKRLRKRWISETATLRETHTELGNASESMVKTAHAIWKTLTMAQLPAGFSDSTGINCFETLWRPEGRGAIENLSLIQWIDDNAHFEIGHWTLREWSQITPPSQFTPSNPIDTIGDFSDTRGGVSSTSANPGKPYTTRDLNTFIGAICRVLGSGMELASIDYEPCSVAMVHPEAQANDEVFYIQGCSIPVVLRKDPKSDESRYVVIGGAYLHEDFKDQFLWKKTDDLNFFRGEIYLC